ncbi:MAG: hypothetical protein J5950_03430 [Clostridia bacterium]|nr:hypothetical protein [Clostridia bacterium]
MGTVEQFVKKKTNKMAILLVILYFIAAGLITFGIYKLAGRIAFVPAPFLFIAAILASRYTLMMSRVEYEYSVNTGVLNIDVIYDQTRRKPVINVNASAITAFGRLYDDEAKHFAKSVQKVVYCASSDENEQAYYFVCPNENKGEFMYVFEPDEHVLHAIEVYNPLINRYLLKLKSGRGY